MNVSFAGNYLIKTAKAKKAQEIVRQFKDTNKEQNTAVVVGNDVLLLTGQEAKDHRLLYYTPQIQKLNDAFIKKATVIDLF